MSWVKASDPLALLAIQAGQVPNPSTQEGAAGSSRLDVDQRSVDIGEAVPIVFARRRNNAGGVLISPGATEARFSNDTSNNVTASYHLVLGEGRMDPIPVKDVFQRACRVGSHTQTYNRRAGTWTPGNFIVERVGFDKPEASYICGSIGLYPDMTTLGFEVTIPNGFDYWRRQVHVFIRGGMWVTRLMDSVTGPSDNFADLVQWMLLNNGRVPAALIDTTALASAAEFLEVNGLTCNCWLREAVNYGDFISSWAPYFLLGESNIGGKKGLRPLLPVNNDGTIKTTAIVPQYVFTEDEIIPGTLDIEYTSWADRQPFVAQMTWRQELGDDAAIIRTAEVRFINSAEAGPYESHDLSAFCTSEAHAVKAGAYIIAKRRYMSHVIRFSARPQAHNKLLIPGSIIRVKLRRTTTGGGPSDHDYLYQVERITKTLAGDVGYECSHFPVDDQARSIVAQIVTAATGSGVLFDTNSSGIGCDINSPIDNTIPDEEFTVPDIDDFDPDDFESVIDDLDIPEIGSGSAGGSGGGGGGGGGAPDENPDDGLDEPVSSPSFQNPSGVPDDEPVPGSALFVPPSACGGEDPEVITVRANGETIASYTNTGGTQTIENNGGALLISDGVISGIVAPAGSEGDVYDITVECPNGNTVNQQATLGANPFPDAQLVWYYSWFATPFDNFASSSYVSVGVPPRVIQDPGSSDPNVQLIEIGLFDGGTGSFQNGIFGDLAVQINKVVYAETVTGNATANIYDVVSENIFG